MGAEGRLWASEEADEAGGALEPGEVEGVEDEAGGAVPCRGARFEASVDAGDDSVCEFGAAEFAARGADCAEESSRVMGWGSGRYFGSWAMTSCGVSFCDLSCAICASV